MDYYRSKNKNIWELNRNKTGFKKGYQPNSLKDVKVIPLHAMEAHGVRKGIAPDHS
jgi:hypothetical protein